MAHDVFVSYANKDKATADALVAALEQHQIRCWIAPRDVLPGQDYADALIEAIGDAQVMVLVFSANANNSPHVMREVERAASKGIAILPLRIEDVAPSSSMEYFISRTHWLDALTPPIEQHLQQLAETVQLLLARSGRAPVGEEPEPIVERKIEQTAAASWLSSFWGWTTGGSKWRLAAVIGVPVIVLLVIISVIADDGEPPEPTPAPPVAVATPTTLTWSGFLVQPETQETVGFTVDTPSRVSFSWTSTNSGGLRDGAPGEVDASLTGPGGFNVSWDRFKEKTGGFDAAPGRYTFTFNNWFSAISAKEIAMTVIITPD